MNSAVNAMNVYRRSQAGLGLSDPTIQASILRVTDITNVSMSFSVMRGNGSSVLVVMKAASPVDSLPVDGQTYSGSSVFGSGSQLGTGNYVVYNGAGSTFTVTGLTADTAYYIRAFEFNTTKYLTDSTTLNPIQSNSFTTQYAAVNSYWVAQGFTRPALYRRIIDNERIKNLITHAVYSGIDTLYIADIKKDGGDVNCALTNYITPGSFSLVIGGTVTFTDDGFQGSANGFLNGGWIPSAGVNFTQNSGSVFGSVLTNQQANDRIWGCTDLVRSIIYLPRNASNQSAVVVNDLTGITITSITDGSGFAQNKRKDASTTELFKSGVSVSSQTIVSVGRPTVAHYWLARNNNGTAATFSTNTLGRFGTSSSLDTKENNLYTDLMVPLTSTLYPYVSVSTWRTRASAADNQWVGIAWSAPLSLYAAVSQGGEANGIMTSPDGVTWTARTNPSSKQNRHVIWIDELALFVACCLTGTGNRISTSPDGITWTSRTTPADNQWTCHAWSPSLSRLVVVANTGTGNRVMYSSDAINWTIGVSAADSQWRSVTWSEELQLFVAVAELATTSTSIMTSPDGITWTLRNCPVANRWQGVTWAKELSLFISVAISGTGDGVMTSPDGINWNSRVPSADIQWRSVRWIKELGYAVAVADSGTGNRIMYSADAITWIGVNSPADNRWIDLCYAPAIGTIAAVSLDGSGNRVMTSLPYNG